MPVKYVEIMDSHGNPRGTDQIAYVYRNYNGPLPKYNEVERFSMNISQSDLDEFLEYMNIPAEEVDWSDCEDPRYSFTLNYKKNPREDEANVMITNSGCFMFEELCFQECFIKVIEKEKGETDGGIIE